jgi:hypothetical protein
MGGHVIQSDWLDDSKRVPAVLMREGSRLWDDVCPTAMAVADAAGALAQRLYGGNFSGPLVKRALPQRLGAMSLPCRGPRAGQALL